MPKPLIDAKQALDDIRAGLDERALMGKFNLSAKGLLSLFTKLVSVGAVTQDELAVRLPKLAGMVTLTEVPHAPLIRKLGVREIKAQEAVKDIQAGMSDTELMEKYVISAQGLQHLIQQMIKAGLLSQSDIDRRMGALDSTVDVRDTEVFPVPDAEIHEKTLEMEAEIPPLPTETTSVRPKPKERLIEPKWTCPACGKPFTEEYDECPVCGVIVSRFLALQAKQ
jgi:hypothetical protein